MYFSSASNPLTHLFPLPLLPPPSLLITAILYDNDVQPKPNVTKGAVSKDRSVSRNGAQKGSKKGGGGNGKGTWGKGGDQEGCAAAIGKGDPNYDSSEEA